MEKAQSASVESIPEVLEECTSPADHSDSASVHDMDYVNPRGVRFTQSSQKEGEFSRAVSASSPPPSCPLSVLSLDHLGPKVSAVQILGHFPVRKWNQVMGLWHECRPSPAYTERDFDGQEEMRGKNRKLESFNRK